MTRIGLIGGTNSDFSFAWDEELPVRTAWGEVVMSVGRVGDSEVLFIRRHGQSH